MFAAFAPDVTILADCKTNADTPEFGGQDCLHIKFGTDGIK